MHEDEFGSKLQLFHRWVCTRPNLFKTEIPPTPQEHQLFQFSLESMLSIFLCPLSFPFTVEVSWWVWSYISPFRGDA